MSSNASYVIDTHPLIWHLAGSPKVKAAARQALARIERGEALGLIPAIVLAELSYLFEKGRTGLSLKRVLIEIDLIPFYQVIPLEREQVEEIAKLTEIPEMHDRMIVAVAKLKKAKLITKDQAIKDSGLVVVVWD